MTSKEFQGLVEGEPIRNIVSGKVYIVRAVQHCDDFQNDQHWVQVELVRYVMAMNPSEWERLPPDIHDRVRQEHNHA